MEIRPATAADVPAVLPLVARACAFHQRRDPAKYGFIPQPQERYRNWLIERAADPRSAFFIAVENGRTIGFIVGTVEREVPVYVLREYGFLHDLWVDEDQRKHGAGRALLTAAMERFGQIGVEQVRLDVLHDNDPARRLFAACGFRPATVQMLRVL